MNPQCENGYVRIANELFEALAKIRIPGESMQILLAILRKTYGYNKIQDKISLSQFLGMTGINKPCICRAISRLISMNIIKKENHLYSLQKNYTAWKSLMITPVIKNDNESLSKMITNDSKSLSKMITPVIKNDNESLSKMITPVIKNDNAISTKDTSTKDTSTKDTSTKDKGVEFKNTWYEYLKMRIKIRKPATERAQELTLRELNRLAPEDESLQIKILEQSIQHSWQGVFELKKAAQEEEKSNVRLKTENSRKYDKF